jgi:hypothetical protein
VYEDVTQQWQRAFDETLGRYQQLSGQLAKSDQAAHSLPTLWESQLDQVSSGVGRNFYK